MANNINIELKILAEQAVASLKSFSNNTKSQLGSLEKAITTTNSNIENSFDSLKTAASGAIAAIGFKHLIDSGIEAQSSLDKLNATLKFIGSNTPVAAFEELANEIQNLTGANDELVLEQAALLKTLGATNGQVDQIIRTAAELSTVFNQDLGSSVNELVQTFSGNLPRALAKSIPELKNLSKEQLASGEAVTLLQNKLNGLSENLRTSAGVSLKRFKEDFGNLIEEIGKLIVNSPAFISAINGASAAFKGLTEFVKELPRFLPFLIVQAQIFGQEMKIAFLEAAQGATDFLKKIPVIGDKLNTQGITKSIEDSKNEIKSLQNVLDTIAMDKFDEDTKNASVSLKKAKDGAKGLGAEVENLDNTLKSFLSSINNPEFKKQAAIEESANKIREASKLFRQGTIDAKQFNAAVDAIGKQTLETVIKVDTDRINEIANNPAKLLIDVGFDFKKLNNIDLSGLVKGVGNSITQGAEGARKLISSVLQEGAKKMFGPIGEAAAPFIDAFTQGPAKVKEMITGFITAIPQILKNIILSIPALIEALINSIPQFIEGLVQAVPELITSIINSIPRIINSFIASIPKIIESLIQSLPLIIQSLIRAIPTIISTLANQMPFLATKMAVEFIKQIPRMVSEMASGFVNAIKDAIGGIGDLFGGGDGGGGFLSDIGGFLGFAKGGYVPAGFPNDTFPASLSSGEYVIDRSLTSSLTRFLDSVESGNTSSQVAAQSNQQQSQNLSITLNIGEEQLASVLLNLNRQGFRIS